MKQFFRYLFMLLFLTGGVAVNAQSRSHSIIPEPVSVSEKSGVFKLPKVLSVGMPQGDEHLITFNFLKERFSAAAGSEVLRLPGAKGHLQLILNSVEDEEIGAEGYRLNVGKKRVTIRANSSAGLFYGAQTLVQLFPPEIESNELQWAVNWEIPAVEIVDYPRVGWRGMMLDVSRHFFTVDEVKQYIDKMTRFKFNRFHWHLTDDEGWRIEIKSLPKLTEVGAWREERIGWFGSLPHLDSGVARDYGGFYTQDEIREVVRYAKERFVEVMPEIDVPGHSSAILASYPELACFPDGEGIMVRNGGAFLNWSTPRVSAIYENTLNPASEKVYEFLDKVMGEVAELFPFEYIHTGGDEAPYTFWEKSEDVAQLMERENLKNMAQVQSYFGKRLEQIILNKGKKMMGWDEILEGGITETTGLMSWRGIQYGVEASKSGHYVVMSPMQYVYIDLMQGDLSTDPRVYQSLRLNQTYRFDPVPEGADERYVLGGQTNLWTEQVFNMRQAEYMAWPRGMAVAESVWSPAKNKSWDNFIRKTEIHFDRFDHNQTKYSRAMFDPIVRVKKEGGRYLVELTTEINGLDIYTSFDNSEPDQFYPKYKAPQQIPADASLMRIVTYRGNEKTGRMMTITVDDLKKRAR